MATALNTVTILSPEAVLLSTVVMTTVSDAFAVCPDAMTIVESSPHRVSTQAPGAR